MPYRLRMPAQIGEWLADLRSTEPIAATELGATLIAVLNSEGLTGLPFIRKPLLAAVDPREVLDLSYHEQLQELQHIRRRVAYAATNRQAAEGRLDELARDPSQDPAGLDALRLQANDARGQEDELVRQSQRLQAQVDAFRTRKETIKAIYTAAEAQARIAELMEKLERTVPPSERSGGEEPADAPPGDTEPEATTDSDGAGHGVTADSRQPQSASASGVLEIYADPLGADIRVLFAVEPEGVVSLLTVLEGRDAISDSGSEALDLAGELLDEIRAAESRSAEASADDDWLEFAEPSAFLQRFFAGESSSVTERAAQLERAQTLAMLREQRGISLRALAHATGIDVQRLSAMEGQGLQDAGLHELAAYLRQLGGRLELTAVIDDERHSLG